MKVFRIVLLIAVVVVLGAAVWASVLPEEPSLPPGFGPPLSTPSTHYPVVVMDPVVEAPPLTASTLGPLRLVATQPVPANIPDRIDLGGIGILGNYLYLVTDQNPQVEVLKLSGDRLETVKSIPLAADKTELGLEAVAIGGEFVYAIGSHACSRPKPKAKSSYAANREKLHTLIPAGTRDILVRFRPNRDGSPGPIERTSLRAAIDSDPVLRPFANLPSKENGVEVQGLAVKGDDIYVGFRSPVLRDNFVPVMRTRFGTSGEHDLLYLTLGGRGIRDMASVQDGFLILAGPAADTQDSFQIVHWNGLDCVKGATPPGNCVVLAEVPRLEKGKPEGLCVTTETQAGYDLAIVLDGAQDAVVARYHLAKEQK